MPSCFLSFNILRGMISLTNNVDVIVVGAGHAGCEAAMVSAKMGKDTLLFTMDLDRIARMSCNPAIGGPGKSHLVREIDALGGAMALITDRSKINIRRLNTSKGMAMRVTRAQVDRVKYSNQMKYFLEGQSNLRLVEGLVQGILIEDDKVCGVVTREKTEYRASSVVLATGTFLRGKVYQIGRAHV